MLIIFLFALGILLIGFEIIVPGGILGSLGGILMFAACVLSYLTFGAAGGTIAVVSGLGVAALAIFIELRILPRTKLGRRAFLTREITAVSSNLAEEGSQLVGQTAEAVTMLSPTGYVTVGGRRFEAFCRTGQVPAGSILEVISADNFRLVVNPLNTNRPN